MAQISLLNMDFAYDGSQESVFENFNISFDTNWRLGLIARNGRGKTTLLKLLAGELKPLKGFVHCPSAITPVVFPPVLKSLTGDTTGMVIAHAMPELEEWRFLRELSLLSVDNSLVERPFETLSPGEQGKILLAALFSREDAYILLDEPGNHLDVDGKEILTSYLSGKKRFLLVSHERLLLDAVTDHSMALLKSHPEIVAGPYHVWADHRRNVEDFERSENAKLAKEINILEKSAQQTGQWAEKAHRNSRKDDGSGVKFGLKEKNRAKAMKLDHRAKQTIRQKDRAAAEKGKLLHDIEENEPLKMNPMVFHSDSLIRAADLTLRYDEKILLQKTSFQIKRGERVCLTGQNGAGKSTLLNLISGDTPSAELTIEGSLHVTKGIRISKLPQTSNLPQMKLLEYVNSINPDQSRVLTLLRKMDFPREVFQSEVSDLSSGQKRKLLLALSICDEAHLYLWDEPLNYLDIQSREQIEEVLLTAAPTMIFIEHDAYFCKKLATTYIQLPDGKQTF
ncbi:MAG: ribosomal protection-like ABC-F family protein [Lachnospiraceae bacterium]